MTAHVISVDLPDDALLTGEILILSFIDESGTERWDVRVGTPMIQSQIVGLLEMAKHSFLNGSAG